MTSKLRLEQCELRKPCTDKLDRFYDAMIMLAYRISTLQTSGVRSVTLLHTAEL
jgi:hypothetical protein